MCEIQPLRMRARLLNMPSIIEELAHEKPQELVLMLKQNMKTSHRIGTWYFYKKVYKHGVAFVDRALHHKNKYDQSLFIAKLFLRALENA